MKSSAVCVSALLSAVSVSAAQNGGRELQIEEVACEVAQFLDERSLIDFSKSSLLFSQAGRKAIGMRMSEQGDLSADPYPGPMIDCNSAQQWDKMAHKIGKSDKRAILTLGDEYAFFRGVPEDAKPGYTGQFISTVQYEGAQSVNVIGPFKGQSYAVKFDGNSRVVQRLTNEDSKQSSKPALDDRFYDLKWIDPERIVQFRCNPRRLEVFGRHPTSKKIGELVHTLLHSGSPIMNTVMVRHSHEYDGPEIISISAKPGSKGNPQSTLLTYSVYHLNEKEIGKPKEKTVCLSFHSKKMTHKFSKDGRFIVTSQENGPMLAITDTFNGWVKETFILHSRNEGIKVTTDVNNRYCLIRIYNSAINRRTDLFLDLETAEIIGSAMHNGDGTVGWIGTHLFRFRDYLDENYARSVYQPRDRINLDQNIRQANENNVVLSPNNDILHGHWERDSDN